uniref:Uncharacterized protein n=1 Tax=Trypanosoma congolense (strain IL3000) TaxID=1068625 RepID=G0UQ16_TRYCI|nr:hypothetical protein, unlikely [Trypanosoma congolense IL3000]
MVKRKKSLTSPPEPNIPRYYSNKYLCGYSQTFETIFFLFSSHRLNLPLFSHDYLGSTTLDTSIPHTIIVAAPSNCTNDMLSSETRGGGELHHIKGRADCLYGVGGLLIFVIFFFLFFTMCWICYRCLHSSLLFFIDPCHDLFCYFI